MKRIVVILLLLPFIAAAQKIKVNEYDKFLKKKRIESYPLTLKAAGNTKMAISFASIGTSFYVQLSGSAEGAQIIGIDDQVIFLLDNDSTITAKSKGLQSYDYDAAKTASIYKHDYVLSLSDLQQFSRHNLRALRKYRSQKFDDVYIPKETGDKLRKLSALFIEELKKGKVFQAAQPVALKNVALKDVAEYVGDSVTVTGRIVSGRYLPDSKDAVTLFNVGAAYPDQLLTVVIRGTDRKNFGSEPEKSYSGKEARITGRVELYKEKPQIVISKKEQLVILADTPSFAGGKSSQTTSDPVKKEDTTKLPVIAREPAFPGGQEVWINFLYRNLKPPPELEAGEEKTVTVQFMVSADGTVSDFQIIQSAGSSFDNEVLRVLRRMPKWKPAIENGRPVDAVVTQPVTFFRSSISTRPQF